MTDHDHEALDAEIQHELARGEAWKALLPLLVGHPDRTVTEALVLLDPKTAKRVRAALPEVVTTTEESDT